MLCETVLFGSCKYYKFSLDNARKKNCNVSTKKKLKTNY